MYAFLSLAQEIEDDILFISESVEWIDRFCTL